MKKLFLLLAAFTCMPTYSRPHHNDELSGIGTLVIFGGLCYGTYRCYKKYYNTPSNTSQPTNTPDENSNDKPKNITPLDSAISLPSKSLDIIISLPNKSNDNNDTSYEYIDERTKEYMQQIDQHEIKLNQQIKEVKKIAQAETHKKSSSGYFPKNIVKMMLDI